MNDENLKPCSNLLQAALKSGLFYFSKKRRIVQKSLKKHDFLTKFTQKIAFFRFLCYI